MTAATASVARVGGLASRRWALDLGASALLLAVGIAGFWPTFDGPSYLGAAGGALVLGLGIAGLAAWRRWGILVIAGLTVVAYFLFGGALALPQTCVLGFVPTLQTLSSLAVGVVTSWKALLTTVAPVSAADGFLVVPFLMTLVASVLTASLALRLRQAAWALLPAAVYLVAQIVLGMSQPAVPVVQGIVFAVVAIGWLAVRQAWMPADEKVMVAESSSAGPGLRRLVAGAAVLALAAGVGVAAQALAAPAQPREVLRDVVIPPFDVHQYPSPLQSFRRYVRDDKTTDLFTVTGLPQGARVRLATLDAYTGVVYDVATGGGASGEFAPLQSNMSAGATGTPATIRFDISHLTGVWLPDVGSVRSFTFTGKDADALRRSGNYNPASGSAVVTQGLASGDAYTVDTIVPSQPTDAQLAKAAFAPLTLPKTKDVPDDVQSKAADIVSKATTPIQQVRALQKTLATDGYFSHGLAGEATSLAGHGAERIAALLGGDQMVGDDEQYAVAMALMARSLGIPARVVMGFHPDDLSAAPGTFTATGDTLHAWVEVAFQGYGWVPFDPTPPKDHVATEQQPKPKPKPKPQVPQPPPPLQQPADQPPTVQKDKAKDHKSDPFGAILLAVLGIGGGVVGVLAVLSAPFVVIGALKATRRRRRRSAPRPADRISGGWDELMDRASDYGARIPPGATRAEDAAVAAVAVGDPQVTTLARRADGEVFGPAEPTPEEIDAFWSEVDGIVGGMGDRATFWRRLGARLSLRSLLADTRLAGAVRGMTGAVADRARAARTELSRPKPPKKEGGA
jgi:hypothetical protein